MFHSLISPIISSYKYLLNRRIKQILPVICNKYFPICETMSFKVAKIEEKHFSVGKLSYQWIDFVHINSLIH